MLMTEAVNWCLSKDRTNIDPFARTNRDRQAYKRIFKRPPNIDLLADSGSAYIEILNRSSPNILCSPKQMAESTVLTLISLVSIPQKYAMTVRCWSNV